MKYSKTYNGRDLSWLEVFGCCLGVIVFALLMWVISGFVIMWAWNLVVPAAFNGPQITFIQGIAVGVFITLIRGVTFRASN